ncbi:MAG: hypothetical protein J5501_11200 [Ruminococcus sp.]|nr:hypothetical protein [Ruminococcus sp.]
MMKGFARFICIIAVMALSLFLVSNLGYPENYSKGYTDSLKSAFVDERNIFSQAEVDEINERVREVSAKTKLNIYISASSRAFYSEDATRIYADDEYDRIFGEDTDGLYYFMDFAGKSDSYDYLSLSGRACLQFADSFQHIVDSTGDHLPYSYQIQQNGLETYKDQIADAINYFLSMISTYSDGNREVNYVHTEVGKYIFRRGGDLYVTYSKPPFIRMKILLIGEIAGLIVGLIIYLSTKSTYKFKSKTDPSLYVDKSDIHFYTRTDAFLRTHTSRHAISTDSGGGGGRTGGGGGHSFSGGHTGGGHHR